MTLQLVESTTTTSIQATQGTADIEPSAVATSRGGQQPRVELAEETCAAQIGAWPGKFGWCCHRGPADNFTLLDQMNTQWPPFSTE